MSIPRHRCGDIAATGVKDAAAVDVAGKDEL
jgi:hypothetical protein